MNFTRSWCIRVFLNYLFIFREKGREKERERNIDVREKHQSVASRLCTDQGLNPQAGYVP